MRESESEGPVQLPDDGILRGWYVIGVKSSYPHETCGFHSNVHRLGLQLSTEYPTAHDPGVDFEQVGYLRVRAHNHRANKAVVAEPVDQAELQGEAAVGGDKPLNILKGMAPGCQIKLISLADELCDTREFDGLEGPKDHGHLEPAQKVVHALGRFEEGFS